MEDPYFNFSSQVPHFSEVWKCESVDSGQNEGENEDIIGCLWLTLSLSTKCGSPFPTPC